ncbi:AmpG family muropeptide MFS transporter [Sedimenticola selenatireducens]|uniref:AmpG family muropeptide MFS transporter n=1 Tax=Sedimenticola selenatireducens TaxID=191960 RepID=A0A558DTW5_9GAMM|nr:MFS transporter [Sedimenticola selenatireducens]TVO77055.1 AmpG family muropeptide MFS transporter [Sedimenticola selenatireducens]TVT64497.1 MAG: AmpG family muropeptide MFS transporter [Sedimenticola selenatireducens]
MVVAEGKGWAEALRAYRHPKVLTLFFLGFSAGLPLLLIFSTLSLWLRDADVDRSTVTYFSWAALGYSFKFIWAPIVDRLPLPLLTAQLGRRRSWLLLAQLSIIGAIVWMAFTDPAEHLTLMAFAAVLLGFSGATQDIVIDAYRIESANRELQALMASTYIAGYRIGMLVAGAGALKLAVWFGAEGGYNYPAWQWTYLCMAAVMLVGVITTLRVPEPEVVTVQKTAFRSTADYLRFLLLFVVLVSAFAVSFFLARDWFGMVGELFVDHVGLDHLAAGFLAEMLRLLLSVVLTFLVARFLVSLGLVQGAVLRETYLDPVADFFRRYGRIALLILLLVGLYRVSDIVLGVISNVFYQDVGFSKDQIADITKTFGLIMTIMGGFLGGMLSLRYGVMRILFLGALLSAGTNLLFLLLAQGQADVTLLIVVITADNLSAGLAGAAFVAYLSGLTHVAFTAFQYALFSSLMTLLPKLLGGYSGSIVDAIGYERFFLMTALLGLPVLLLIYLANRFIEHE